MATPHSNTRCGTRLPGHAVPLTFGYVALMRQSAAPSAEPGEVAHELLEREEEMLREVRRHFETSPGTALPSDLEVLFRQFLDRVPPHRLRSMEKAKD
jgi:hypothetical protein